MFQTKWSHGKTGKTSVSVAVVLTVVKFLTLVTVDCRKVIVEMEVMVLVLAVPILGATIRLAETIAAAKMMAVATIA